MAARIPPAATSPKSTVNRPWNSAMATGIVFPREEESEQGGSQESRSRQRQSHAEERTETAGTVDPGRVFQVSRDGPEVAAQDPQDERRDERAVHDDKAHLRVEE